jgi:hypothetical protein
VSAASSSFWQIARRSAHAQSPKPQPTAWRPTPAEAVGVIASLASFTLFPVPVALVCCAATAALVSLDERRRWRQVLRVSALALTVGAIAAALLGSSRPTVRWHWDRSATDLASAADSVGYFPSRPALVCTTGTVCETGQRPLLNSLMFGNSGFRQGIRDERRFLMAGTVRQQLPVYLTSDLRPMHDPLRVAPGDEIEVAGIVDNAGDPASRTTTARDVRVLLAFPNGAGTRHALVGSVSIPLADPTAVSDSVAIESRAPTYLRYVPGSAVVVGQQGSVRYRLPDEFFAPYDADRLDRRALAGKGARVGCSRPDGIVPAGRGCAVRFAARFDVRYAASAIDVNGIGGIAQGFSEVVGTVRGRGEIPLYWAPHLSAVSYLGVRSGRVVSIDCVLYTGTSTWYHVADAAKLRDGPIYGYDTAFIRGRNVVDVRNTPDCLT